MGAKNGLEREELRLEISSSADQVVSGERHRLPEMIEFHTEVQAGSSVSGAELRELIRSKGGMRAVQELLRQHRGIQASTLPPDAARLRELPRLLAKQHSAEHLEKGGNSDDDFSQCSDRSLRSAFHRQAEPTSSADQAAACMPLVQYSGGQVVGTHLDSDVSGYKRNRPGLKRMLADVRAGLIDIVVSEALDRLARDGEDVNWLGRS